MTTLVADLPICEEAGMLGYYSILAIFWNVNKNHNFKNFRRLIST